MNTDILPKEIVYDAEANTEIAWFEYNSGCRLANELGLKQTTNFSDVMNNTHFIVCCGEVGILTNSTQFVDIQRRII